MEIKARISVPTVCSLKETMRQILEEYTVPAVAKIFQESILTFDEHLPIIIFPVQIP